MTTTTTKIIALLKITPEAYESMALDWWIRYTKCYAHDSSIDWQKLLANSALNAFWLRQKSYKEKQFLEDFGSYAYQIPADELLRKYNYEVGVRLLTIHSPALLESARKLNIIPIHN